MKTKGKRIAQKEEQSKEENKEEREGYQNLAEYCMMMGFIFGA